MQAENKYHPCHENVDRKMRCPPDGDFVKFKSNTSNEDAEAEGDAKFCHIDVTPAKRDCWKAGEQGCGD
jgi:hypothetical protein